MGKEGKDDLNINATVCSLKVNKKKGGKFRDGFSAENAPTKE